MKHLEKFNNYYFAMPNEPCISYGDPCITCGNFFVVNTREREMFFWEIHSNLELCCFWRIGIFWDPTNIYKWLKHGFFLHPIIITIYNCIALGSSFGNKVVLIIKLVNLTTIHIKLNSKIATSIATCTHVHNIFRVEKWCL